MEVTRLNFKIPEEYEDFKEAVYQFSKEQLAPHAAKQDELGEFSLENWRAIGKMGYLGLPFPEEFGGSNASPLALCLAMEAMAAAGVDAGTTLSWGAHTVLTGVPIWLLGNAKQKEKYLPKICSGEWIGAFALTEHSSGSDAASMRTTASAKGDRWILNGSKMFITNAPIANFFIVFASTNPLARNKGISAFIVESGDTGLSIGKDLKKMGNRTSVTAELYFDNCEVPEENLLGQKDFGFLAVGKETLEWERSCMIAPIIGGMEYMLKVCVEYAKTRRQFGSPIANFQAIQRKLVDMKIAVEGARLLVYRVAWMKQNGQSAMIEAAISKLWATEAAVKVANDAVQIFGGYGYISDYPAERFYRDAKLGTLGAGTSEVQKMVIASELIKIYTRGTH